MKNSVRGREGGGSASTNVQGGSIGSFPEFFELFGSARPWVRSVAMVVEGPCKDFVTVGREVPEIAKTLGNVEPLAEVERPSEHTLKSSAFGEARNVESSGELRPGRGDAVVPIELERERK